MVARKVRSLNFRLHVIETIFAFIQRASMYSHKKSHLSRVLKQQKVMNHETEILTEKKFNETRLKIEINFKPTKPDEIYKPRRKKSSGNKQNELSLVIQNSQQQTPKIEHVE